MENDWSQWKSHGKLLLEKSWNSKVMENRTFGQIYFVDFVELRAFANH